MSQSKNILIVVRWPLGGIRTYMRYVFSHFPSNYKLTVLAATTQEDEALKEDVKKYNAELRLVKLANTRNMTLAVYKELSQKKYDLIISQGYVSAVTVFPVNIFFRLPHILTIHGVVEPHYLTGRASFIKRWFLGRVLSSVTLLYAVSNDILQHLYHEYPHLQNNGPESLVIWNGIEISDLDTKPHVPINLRNTLGIDSSIFLFGFFGRFMPQKGFDLIIQAVEHLRDHGKNDFAVIAVGSGDYVREYQSEIKEKKLNNYFYFLPFQPMVHSLYKQVDAVLMPSRWEASGLLAMEALSVGTPLVASDCIGLRETIKNTPAFIVKSEDIKGLVVNIETCMKNNNLSEFVDFMPHARNRYDTRQHVKKYVGFIDGLFRRG